MEWFIIWLLFGVVTAVVAANKRRNVIGWLVLGFLLGPFGLILSLVVSKNQAEVEQEAIESGARRKCPFCAELIRREAVKCRFCGSEVPPVVEPDIPGVVQCPSCGKRVKPKASETRCYLCGGFLGIAPRPEGGS